MTADRDPFGPNTASELRERLAGVRALVLDADGVVVHANRPLPGWMEALATLDRRAIPFRILTNFSIAHRRSLTARFGPNSGLAPDGSSIITASSAAAALTARSFPAGPLLVLGSPDALREWDGQRLLTLDEADARHGSGIAAVVVGDASDALTFRALDVAFRTVRSGAAFIAMHRNLWWETEKGPTLDAGAFVLAIERATGRRATVAGKPSPVVFRQAIRELRAELAARSAGRPPLRPDEIAMVGDDVVTDLLAAKRVGLRGILVLSGKHGPSDVGAIATRRRGGGQPDAVAPSLAEVVAALD